MCFLLLVVAKHFAVFEEEQTAQLNSTIFSLKMNQIQDTPSGGVDGG